MMNIQNIFLHYQKIVSIMKRRITVNIFLAYIVFTGGFILRDYIQLDLLNDHTNYSGHALAYNKLMWLNRFIISPTVFLVVILLPYNITILRIMDKRYISLFRKILVFELVFVIIYSLFGIFINVWTYPYWQNILLPLYFFPISALFASLIHFFADIRPMKKF